MDTRSDPLLAYMREASPASSDDDGGVKLEGYYSKPAAPKQEKEDANVKSKPLQSHDDSGSSSKKRKRQEEDHDSKPNPYLAHQYEKPTKKESDPKSNPYLAHMYEGEEVEDKGYNGYSNSYGKAMNRAKGVSERFDSGKVP